MVQGWNITFFHLFSLPPYPTPFFSLPPLCLLPTESPPPAPPSIGLLLSGRQARPKKHVCLHLARKASSHRAHLLCLPVLPITGQSELSHSLECPSLLPTLPLPSLDPSFPSIPPSFSLLLPPIPPSPPSPIGQGNHCHSRPGI